MARATVSEVAEKYLNQWAEALTDGSVQLWELPPSVAQYFYLGYNDGRASRQLEVEELERAANRLHNLAYETNKERRDRIEARLSQALEQATTEQWEQLDKDLAVMAGQKDEDVHSIRIDHESTELGVNDGSTATPERSRRTAA